MGKVKITLTNAERDFILDALDSAREEFEVLVMEEEWYVTELNEICLEAHTILKHAEKEECD